MEVLPDERRKRYLEKGISLVNANKLIQNKQLSDFLLGLEDIDLVIASNLLLGDISAYLNKTEKDLSSTKLTKDKFRELVSQLSSGEITNKVFKAILNDLMETDSSMKEIISSRGIQTISDTSYLTELVDKVLKENEASVLDYKAGKDRALKYLMGQIMKESKGSANPSLVNQLLVEELSKR